MRLRGEHGAAEALGLVLMTPMVVAVAVVVVLAGLRVDQASVARSLSHAAAQAAALERDPESARRAAEAVVSAMTDHDGTCPTPMINVDLSDHRADGSVSTMVRCGSGIGRSQAVVDRFRLSGR